MSPRAARLLAVPFIVLAFLCRFGAALRLEPLTWGVDPSVLGLPAFLLLSAATLGVPLGIYLLLSRHARVRPSSWRADTGRRLVVGPTPVGTAFQVILVGWMAGGLIPTERVPGEDQKRVADLGAYTTVMTALAVLALLVAVWIVMGSRPWLALDRDTVTIKRIVRETRIRWEDLPADLRDLRIPTARLHIAPEFLDFSLRTYREDPARRAAIGTPAETTALESAYEDERRP
ncbi:hypothetical protein [Actinoplanes xinjiangensis]|uniref:hypothetical protein n=1 Tax=Actinoplanes xinjiangensis TaxID=512350 RepID=UPI00343F7DB8